MCLYVYLCSDAGSTQSGGELLCVSGGVARAELEGLGIGLRVGASARFRIRHS